MNLKSRIKRLEASSGAVTCACPNIVVIRPGGENPKLCKRCLTSGEISVVLPSLDYVADTPQTAEILSGAGKVYAGFNPDLV